MPRLFSTSPPHSTLADMPPSEHFEDPVPHSRLSFSSNASTVHPGVVKSFNDPEGFTSCIVVEDSNPEEVFNYLSNPETLIYLSPSIICLSSKDVNFPDRQGKQSVELNITFYMHSCYACRRARTATANFRVERQNMSLFLTLRPGTHRSVTHHLTVEHYEGGTRVVNKVDVPSGIFRAIWRGRMKREQEGFLDSLNDAVRGIRLSSTRNSFATKKKQKKPLESPLLVTEI